MKSSNDSSVQVNPNGQLSGRSFYICNDIECVSNVFKKLKIFKILRIEPDELLREKIHAVLDK